MLTPTNIPRSQKTLGKDLAFRSTPLQTSPHPHLSLLPQYLLSEDEKKKQQKILQSLNEYSFEKARIITDYERKKTTPVSVQTTDTLKMSYTT